MKRNTEAWKKIISHPDYAISNFGRVKSFKNEKPRIMKQGTNSWGYPQVNLQLNKKQRTMIIHLLVINHFGPPKPSKIHECNHIDGDKLNNWWTNLEWLTPKQNQQHASRLGLTRKTADHYQPQIKLNIFK